MISEAMDAAGKGKSMIAPVKEAVQDVLRSLPDDCSWEQVLYQLYLRREIEIGAKQADAGDLIDDDDLFRELLSDEDSVDIAGKATA